MSPLIGLLGTVLGVIEAFLGIASKGSGNLSAVAPGVAEALIATAAALAVAIPATFGYNIFAESAQSLRRTDGELQHRGDRAARARRADLSMAPTQRRHRFELNADVNVVSLIDVMLLLLVIFMITAPHDAGRSGHHAARDARRSRSSRRTG